MDIQSITTLRKYLTISDHKPGKMVIKFSMQLLTDNEAMKVINANKNASMPKAIRKSKLNLIMRTVTLEYDTSVISPADFNEILSTKDRKQFEALAEKYRNVLSA